MQNNKPIKEILANFYLEWVNDYLTIEKMAEHKGLTFSHTEKLIAIGEHYHEQRVKESRILSEAKKAMNPDQNY